MPANSKHLNPSFHQRFAKISAGFVGGYLVSVSMFMALALWMDPGDMLITLLFGGVIVWGVLMIIPFLFRNGWWAWLVYLLVLLLFSSVIYFSKIYFPEQLPV